MIDKLLETFRLDVAGGIAATWHTLTAAWLNWQAAGKGGR